MAHGYVLEAEYESGYLHQETPQDRSPYDPARNIFFDILHALPTEAGHGRMVRFSLIGRNTRYDIDWTNLPDNARPIHYMEMERTLTMDQDGSNRVDGGAECLKRGFGFQYTDTAGNNVTKIEEIS